MRLSNGLLFAFTESCPGVRTSASSFMQVSNAADSPQTKDLAVVPIPTLETFVQGFCSFSKAGPLRDKRIVKIMVDGRNG